MNVLWLVNVVLPEAGEKLKIAHSVFGGWLTGALNGIRDRVGSVTVVAIGEKEVTERLDCDVGNVHYTVFPPMTRESTESAFSQLLAEKAFDVVHVHGTEMEHSAAMVAVAPPERTVVSLQGLTHFCSTHYCEGVPESLVRPGLARRAARRLSRHFEEPVADGRDRMRAWGEREVGTLRKCGAVIGRTRWDRACAEQIAPRLRYYSVNETLRDSFYTDRVWSPENCERHSVFLSQAGYPIKGLHYFLRALPTVRQFYPDVRVYIGGGCPVCRREGARAWKDRYFGGYFGYINTFLADNGLYDCVRVLGKLNEEQMAERYLRSNVFVCPSTIENSPNSVGEAMMLGTPVVASYVGGIPDLLDNGREGLLYQSSAPYMLADCIMRIFADDELAKALSRRAVARAHETHDKEKNAKALLDVYDDIVRRSEG